MPLWVNRTQPRLCNKPKGQMRCQGRALDDVAIMGNPTDERQAQTTLTRMFSAPVEPYHIRLTAKKTLSSQSGDWPPASAGGFFKGYDHGMQVKETKTT